MSMDLEILSSTGQSPAAFVSHDRKPRLRGFRDTIPS